MHVRHLCIYASLYIYLAKQWPTNVSKSRIATEHINYGRVTTLVQKSFSIQYQYIYQYWKQVDDHHLSAFIKIRILEALFQKKLQLLYFQ